METSEASEKIMTTIEWTMKTWNPTVGCSKVSPGCQNCYAINQAYRNAAMGAKLENPGRLAYYEGLTEKRAGRVEWTGQVNFVPEALEIPLRTRKPTTWFVNSMSDLFHESVTDEQLDQIFAVMALTPHHTYQVLTKRRGRMLEYIGHSVRRYAQIADAAYRLGASADWRCKVPIPNVWLGVTVENQRTADERREPMRSLAEMGWFTWVSHEPALELVDFSGWEFIKWLVMGGESGPKARSYDLAWPRSVSAWCKESAILFFHKQLGSRPEVTLADGAISNVPWRSTGKGNNPDEWPSDLRVREYPTK